MTRSNGDTDSESTIGISAEVLETIGLEFLEHIAPPPVALILKEGPDGHGRHMVEARREDDYTLLHRDLCNIDQAENRRKFARDVCKKASDLSDKDSLSHRLLEMSETAVASGLTISDASPVVPPLIDVESANVVRPGAFITPGLAGQLVPRLMSTTGSRGQDTLVVIFELMLQHRDGTRVRRPFTATLEDIDGKKIYVASEPPMVGPRTMQVRWTRAAQTRWLEGETPTIESVRDRLCQVVESRIWFPDDVADVLSLVVVCFLVLTYVSDALNVTPYLHVKGPKGSGKSQGVLYLFIDLAFMPIPASDVSAPVVFRFLNDLGGTLLLDEVERLSGPSERAQDVSAVLNAGHQRGLPARRCEREGDKIIVREFDVFGPKLLASVADLPDTLASRCITVPMLRKPPNTTLPRSDVDLAELQNDLHALTLTHAIELRERLRSEADIGLSNRARDLWAPLIRIAAWLDPDGSLDLERDLLHYAKGATAEAEEDHGVPEADEALLRALHGRVLDGTQRETTPADLLGEVQRMNPLVFQHWNPTRVGKALAGYRLKSLKRGGSRYYSEITREQLEGRMVAYGIDIPISGGR